MRDAKSKKKSNPFEGMSPVEGEAWIRQQNPNVIIVGVDEAGRGPLAGPVVAAAVVLDHPESIPGLQDSKKLTEHKREELFPEIIARAKAWAIAEASPLEIDSINILQADFLAMRRALAALGWPNLTVAGGSAVLCGGDLQALAGIILCAVDGNLRIAGVNPTAQLPVVKGDAHVASIAAASILAKVHRDRVMVELDSVYPQYGFSKHKGYPSPTHIEAIRQFGMIEAHRKSFKPKALEQVDLFR